MKNLIAVAVIAATGITTTLYAQPGAGQAWPARPVRLLLPYAPGGGVDIVARTLVQKRSEQLGSSFVVENRPGGTGIVATELVARSAPADFVIFMRAEIVKWTKVVKASNMRFD